MRTQLLLLRLPRLGKAKERVLRNIAGFIIFPPALETTVLTIMIPTSARKIKMSWGKEVVRHPRPRGEAVEAKALLGRIVVVHRVARAKERVVASRGTAKIPDREIKASLKVQVGPQEAREKERPHLPKPNIITLTSACALIILMGAACGASVRSHMLTQRLSIHYKGPLVTCKSDKRRSLTVLVPLRWVGAMPV